MKIHIVQQGDTLWKLAKKYNVDFEQLKVVNSHLSNPDVIMPGMKIKIPTGGVPVKKQIAKKEESIQAKEQPKEAPKKEVKAPEPPVVQKPIEIQPSQQQLMLTQQQYEQHLHNMNMNFNIYKPMPAPVAPVIPPPKVPAPPPKVPAPPKMPDIKELPKMEKPKPMAPPPIVPKKEVPKIDEMPMAKQMLPTLPHCYPVTGVMPGYGYQAPPTFQPYQQAFPQYPPMSQQMGSYGYPQGSVASAYAGFTPAPLGSYQKQQPVYQQPMPMMPNYPQAGYGMGQPPVPPYGMAPPPQQWAPQTNNTNNSMGMDEDFDNDYSTGIPQMVPNANMQMPPNYWQPNFYGDVTMPQPMTLGQQAPQMQMPPQQWGYQQQPMMSQQRPSSPHPVQRQIEEETED